MIKRNETESVLVATIGAEPQVISITIQLLLQRRERVHAVEVLHTHSHLEPIQSSLSALRAVFAGNPHWPSLVEKLIPADDLLEHDDLLGLQAVLFQSLKVWIRRGFRLRLLLAGGRKTSAMMGMATAQLLLRPCDQVLYLSSDEALRLSRRHILSDSDNVQLHTIPLPPTISPSESTQVMQAETPAEAYRSLETDRRVRTVEFLESLTGGELAVVKAVVSGTNSNQQVAAQLNLSTHTVSNRLTSVYGKLETALGRQLEKGIKREALRAFLNS